MSSEDAQRPAASPAGGMPMLRLTDSRAMRALAHPLRLQLLEALAHAGTLTATQASELLGESPANCAFHLRTLARYGYVEEAGGGRGRERPWRRSHIGLQIPSDQDDPQAAIAAREVTDFWLETILTRARAELSRRTLWPADWHGNPLVGAANDLLYVTPEEARELGTEVMALFRRFEDRLDHPERRPPGAVPLEIIQLGYPLLHLAGRPGPPVAEGPVADGTVLPADPGSD